MSLLSSYNQNKEMKPSKKLFFLIFSCIFMLIPVLLSFKIYETDVQHVILWLIKYKETISVDISPSMISTIVAIALYSSLIVRGLVQLNLKTEKRLVIFLELILICLNILFISSFLKLIIDSKPIEGLPFNISSSAILAFAVVVSWIGMKSIAGYVWVLLFIMSITRMTNVDYSMGVVGAFYVLSAFISILFQFIPNNSFSKFGQALMSDFKSTRVVVQEDLSAAKETTKKIAKTTVDIAKTVAEVSAGVPPHSLTDV